MLDQTQRINNTEDDIQRVRLNLDLKVTGLVYKNDENLNELFLKLSSEIDFNPNSMACTPTLDRIPIKNKTTGQMMSSNIIIIHFAILKHKQLFYSKYISKMPLKPENFGLKKDARIVIGENLTKINATLFKQAQTMKKKTKN